MSVEPTATDVADQQPDLPVVGYRSWQLGWNGELRSIGRGVISWLPGLNTALCWHGFAHRAPDAACDCGLYARHLPANGIEAQDEIHGAIVAWGQLHVHADGFRAEHAQVIALVESVRSDVRRRAAELHAARRYGAVLVPADQLETVAREYGDPVDPAVLANLRAQTTRILSDGRARTRREIQTHRAYERLARPVRSVPGLRMLLLCVCAYGVPISAFVWALMLVKLLHAHPHPTSLTISPLLAFNLARQPHPNGAAVINLFAWLTAGIPMLLAGVIWKARQLARSRTGSLPWPAQLRLPAALAIAVALPWLPGHWPATTALTLLIAVAGGTLVAASALYAIEHTAHGLALVMLPGLVAAGALAFEGVTGRAVVAAVWIAAHSAVLYYNRKLTLSG
jgi:hypothetical protein